MISYLCQVKIKNMYIVGNNSGRSAHFAVQDRKKDYKMKSEEIDTESFDPIEPAIEYFKDPPIPKRYPKRKWFNSLI